MAALYHAGSRKPPRTSRRRVGWMVVTLVPLWGVAVLLVVSAVRGWVAIGQDQAHAPATSDTVWLSVGAVVLVVWVTAVSAMGVVRVREQRAEEKARADRAHGSRPVGGTRG